MCELRDSTLVFKYNVATINGDILFCGNKNNVAIINGDMLFWGNKKTQLLD